jgi:cytoskeletal protein RodZ
LTTVPDNTSIAPMMAEPIKAEPKKSSLLPLLTALFVFSYCLMTALIVFQGSTIQSQRNLIVELLADSKQLWATKSKALQDKQAAQAHRHAQTPSSQAEAPSTQAPLNHVPLTQAPSIQAPSTQAPSTQAVPQHRSQNHLGKTVKPRVQLPPQPAADPGDQRRVLFTI